MHLLLQLGNERAWQDAPNSCAGWRCRKQDRGTFWQVPTGCCSRSLAWLLSPVVAGLDEMLEREENLRILSCHLFTAFMCGMNKSPSQVCVLKGWLTHQGMERWQVWLLASTVGSKPQTAETQARTFRVAQDCWRISAPHRAFGTSSVFRGEGETHLMSLTDTSSFLFLLVEDCVSLRIPVAELSS